MRTWPSATWALASVLVPLVVLVSKPCSAQPEDRLAAAKALVAEARELFDAGEHRAAAERYAQARGLVSSAQVSFNEAVCWALAEQPAAAADAFEVAAKLGTLSAEKQQEAEEQLAKLEAELGVVVIASPVGAHVSVAHVQERLIPARVHVAPGEYVVRVVSACAASEETAVVAAQQERHVAIALAPCPEPEPEVPTPAPVSDGSVQRVAAWAAFGTSGVLTAVTIALGVAYLDKRSSFVDGGKLDRNLFDDARSLQTASTAMGIASAGLAALGVVLVVTSPGVFGEHTDARVTFSPDGTWLRASW